MCILRGGYMYGTYLAGAGDGPCSQSGLFSSLWRILHVARRLLASRRAPVSAQGGALLPHPRYCNLFIFIYTKLQSKICPHLVITIFLKLLHTRIFMLMRLLSLTIFNVTLLRNAVILCGPGSSSGKALGYDVDGPGSSPSFEVLEIFPHSFVSRLVLGFTQPLIKWEPGTFPRVKTAESRTRLFLVQGLCICGSLHPHPPCTFIACTVIEIPLHLLSDFIKKTSSPRYST